MIERNINKSLTIESPFKGVTADAVAARAWSSYFEDPVSTIVAFGDSLRLKGSDRLLRNAVYGNRSTIVLSPEVPVEGDITNLVARLEVGLFTDSRGRKDAMFGVRLLKNEGSNLSKPGFEREVREVGVISLGELSPKELSRVSSPILQALAENVEVSAGFVEDALRKIAESEEKNMDRLSKNALSRLVVAEDK